MAAEPRKFLMLQGPHGPFFLQLARRLRQAGHDVYRIGFNAGDGYFWGRSHYQTFTNVDDSWEEYLSDFLAENEITDIVLYGDTRWRHSVALKLGRALGLRLHVFEEGYLRPFWATYERDGASGHSPLMNISIEEMEQALEFWNRQVAEVPAHWGELRQHIFYGALYHARVLWGSLFDQKYVSHRDRCIKAELRSHLKHLALLPYKVVRRYLAQRRILRSDYVYSLVLLQLAHDASIQSHSSFKDMISFIRLGLQDFANHAPKHMHLVFKAHPLEDYFQPLAEYTFKRAAQLGISDRVHFIEGGKLAQLLDRAFSVVTINSTGAQQALWRGLPLRALGRAVYAKPSLVSDQPLGAFFEDPTYPNREDYAIFRRFMMETSQVPGGFYSAQGRASLIRSVLPWLLDDKSQYENIFENMDVQGAVRPAFEEKPLLKLVK